MKITFGQQAVTETEKKNIERRVQQTAEKAMAGQVAYATFTQGQPDIMAGQSVEKGKSLIEIQQAAGNTDADVLQDYMTLAANTMSEEDFAQMQEEGFDFGSMNPEETVTIVDKIKAELVRSGQYVAGYTDDLDMETLAEALGSETLAKAVAESFVSSDIPLTEENMTGMSHAWEMTNQLQPLGEGACEYLIDNELEPEIWNLYLAQSSGAGKGNGTPRFYQENVQGYYARAAENAGDELAEQIDRVIEQSGGDINQENRGNAHWLLEKGLPLTAENLQRLEQLQSVELPVSEEVFAQATARAIAEGKKPLHANLSGGKNMYERAAEVYNRYHGEEMWETVAGDVTARRQLEEIRLRMTAEVNVKLLKSGFAIDTAPMEQLVEALKSAEEALAKQYFPESSDAVDKFHVFRQTNEVVAQLPGLPADVLGLFAENRHSVGLELVHSTGVALQETYRQAQNSYETLMTAPRADLGDSIKKAFANVDDILQDLGLEPVEENRRAVRILGYNRMEITADKIEVIRTADKQVQTVIEKMTPASVLKMIRDGVNPLEKSFAELEQYFDNLPEEYKQQAESYSRFLHGLEKNGEITPEERSGFIGIHRLVRQLEKADGAAVGALVNAQAEIHFSNLLSAVRSGKTKYVDVKIGEQLGAVVELIQKGESISDQIARAFMDTAKEILTDASQNDEAMAEYNHLQYESFRQAVLEADGECVAMLQRGEIPLNADNLLATQMLTHNPKRLLGIFRGGTGSKPATPDQQTGELQNDERGWDFLPEETLAEAANLWESLENSEAFGQSYAELTEKALKAVETATFEQASTGLDVREMQLVHKQLTVASSLAQTEEYFVPMYIGGELSGVHLTLDRTGEEKGTVTIHVALAEGENLQAKLYLEKGVLQGIFSGETENEVMKLEKIADTFRKEAGKSWEVGGIHVMRAGRGAAEGFTTQERNRTQNAELYAVAKAFLKSVQQGEETYEN